MRGNFAGTDRFVIERKLGAGSMGAVYLAFDRELESRVALKTLLSVSASSIYRFKKEFRALADVNHPNLVALHELFLEGDQWFFTMEYVEGTDFLAQVHGGRRRSFTSTPRPVSDHPLVEGMTAADTFDGPVRGMEMLFPSPLLHEERLRVILKQVVRGLMAVHAAGKLHRDMKPENVLITDAGRAVVLDFGIVMDATVRETLTAGIIGTPAYMSPEQSAGEKVGEATDWYALGVMLFEALTGDVPFDGSPVDVLKHKRQLDAPPPNEMVSGVPDDLNTLCVELLHRDPAKRPSGEDILRALSRNRKISVEAPRPVVQEGNFVGRGAALKDLEGALRDTENGKPVVSLIRGPAGIGKTALVDRFIQISSATERAIVLRGRCYERESVPFKAFDSLIDSLSRYLGRLSPPDAARMLPRDVEPLAELFPVLKRVEMIKRRRKRADGTPDPHALRQRAFRALREMLARIADYEPLVICVDDLQWGDVDSARLLTELVSGADAPALLLIGVYRDQPQTSPCLDALLPQLAQANDLDVRRLLLGGLGQADCFALARHMLGPGLEEGARRVAYECKGNPQLLSQLVGHVKERRALGVASPDTAAGLVSFERVLQQRLTNLSSDARTLLELLSVAGRPVPEQMLTLVSTFNIDLQSALAELRAAKLIRGVAVHNARAVEVYHDTIREATVGPMSPDVLQGWHRRLAAALEASGAMDLEALTSHLMGAGDSNRAGIYAARAAAQAAKGLAFEKAARLYGLAVEHSRDPEQRRQLQIRWADALVDAGRGAQAIDVYREAARTAPPHEAAELRDKAAVQLFLNGRVDDGVESLGRALGDAATTIPSSFQQSLEVALADWKRLGARGFAFRERPEGSVTHEELHRLDVRWGVTLGLLFYELDRPPALITAYLRDALDVGEPRRIQRGLCLYHSHVDSAFSRLAETQPQGAIDVAEALSRKLDEPSARAWLALSRGYGVYHDGRIEHALQELERAEEIFRNQCAGAAFEMRLTRLVIAHLTSMFLRGQLSRCTEWLREAEEREDAVTATRLALACAQLSLMEDDPNRAMEQAKNALERWHIGPGGLNGIALQMLEANVRLYVGDPDACLDARQEFDALFETPFGAVPLWRGLCLLMRARLGLAGATSSRGGRAMLDQADQDLEQAATLHLPCLNDELRLTRATVAALRGERQLSRALLEAVLADHNEPHDHLPLTALAALHRLGEMRDDARGQEQVARAASLLRRRGVTRAPRYLRLYTPQPRSR